MKTVLVLYRLSIALWLGGVAIFTVVLTPILFRSLSRDHAGSIVGLLFPAYFRWGLGCGIIALITLLVARGKAALPATILVIMLALTAVQSFYIEPRAAEVKKRIVSFETTPKDSPSRREFARLHGISASCNVMVLIGGIVLVILA